MARATNNTTTKLLIATKGRSETVNKDILTEAEIRSCESIADAIRKCAKKDPTASNGTIARFLTKYHTKQVRVQHVYNVLHQVLKSK